MTTAYSSGKTYLTCAETAKLIRAALKRDFPETRFSVRSSTYAGGASIDVSWTDGPTTYAVDRVAGPYAGADFDGMIDLKTYSETWLLPNGTVTVAHAGGQGSTLPEVIGDPPAPNARLVSLGADYVHTHRTISDAWRDGIAARFAALIGRPLNLDRTSGDWNLRVPLHVRRDGELLRMAKVEDGDYVQDVFHRYTGPRARRADGVVFLIPRD